MEPVPETESMEGFRTSPLPSVRLHNPGSASNLVLPTIDTDSPVKPRPPKPQTLRRSTDPIPTSPKSPVWYPSVSTLPYRPRTTSPLSGAGAHTRSRSTASLAPAMARTQSMPGVNGAGHLLYSPQNRRPASPSESPSRVRAPRKPVDEAFPPTSPVRMTVLEPSERRVTERNSSPNLNSPNLNVSSQIITNPRHRQRPTSPYRHGGSPSSTSLNSTSAFPATSTSQSPSYRGYESFPFYGSTTSVPASSIPSTPTSTRSRSPSISSLETIPDSPDAEEAALEAERIAQLKAAAEAAENAGSESSDSKGRGSLDVPRGRTLGFGSRDKRKRWSVCGAERRGDIDLETIWED